MIQTIVTALLFFILRRSESRFISDFINIFARAKTKKEYRDIYIGSVANLKII
jgi:cadmium resistance protein CadD (predicted permease)